MHNVEQQDGASFGRISDGKVSRRTVAKMAAWSVPVLAVAVASPAEAASLNWDVAVTANCSNNYDLGVLQGLLNGVGLGLSIGLVQTALGLLGLTPGAVRTFTITATAGVVPAGTQFTLSNAGLLTANLVGISGFAALTVANILVINAGTTTITTAVDMPQGTSVTLDLFKALVDVGAISTISLSLVGNDNPVGVEVGADSASISTLVGASVNLGTLGLGLPGLSGLTLAVQVCSA
ncbi:MAG: hypothetical protein ABJB03_01185 [Rhodoglobus sp.]